MEIILFLRLQFLCISVFFGIFVKQLIHFQKIFILRLLHTQYDDLTINLIYYVLLLIIITYVFYYFLFLRSKIICFNFYKNIF